MAGELVPSFSTIIVPGSRILEQPWWTTVHRTIIEAFLGNSKGNIAFPKDWKRLPDDPAATQGLASELGDSGHLIVLLDSQTSTPIACTGVLPYRGKDWLAYAQNGKGNADIANSAVISRDELIDWEVCCFCIDPSHQGKGLSHSLRKILEDFVRSRGGKTLYASYVERDNGRFWPAMGFRVIPDAGSVLRKGFKAHPDREGLREDVTFAVAVKALS